MTVPRDTGDLAHVPEDEQLDVDGGEGSDATDGGLDDDLDHVYANPGDVIDGDLA
jgi:hypothetical protein